MSSEFIVHSKDKKSNNHELITNNSSGMTISEAVIALGIASAVGVLLLVIMVNTTGLFYKESSKVGQGLGSNDSLMKVQQSIKGSSGIASSYTYNSVTYTSGVTQLVLKVPAIDSSGNIISNVFDYFVFYQNQNQLRFKVFPDATGSRKSADQIFSTLVDSLKFQYYDSSGNEVTPTAAVRVKITLTLKQKAGVGYQTSIATSEANLRND